MRHPGAVTALRPDYDDDPERWASWRPPQDVVDVVAPELKGPVLDAACGEGRLRRQLPDAVAWVGLDTSPAQLAANPYPTLVRGDLRALPFADATFAEVTHLWCLYHLDDPVPAVAEAARVLRAGGRYFACCASRHSDPELLPEGYPPSTFDAEEAADIVASVFGDQVEAERWDEAFFPLESREEVRRYCRHVAIPPDRAADVALPLWLTKRGVLVRATKA
jgi:SAM-dependent methyltransferase